MESKVQQVRNMNKNPIVYLMRIVVSTVDGDPDIGNFLYDVAIELELKGFVCWDS